MSRGKIASDRYLGYARTLVPLKPVFIPWRKKYRSALLAPRSNKKSRIDRSVREVSTRLPSLFRSALPCILNHHSRPPIRSFDYSLPTDRIVSYHVIVGSMTRAELILAIPFLYRA